jgi:hypothetical protein
MFAAKTVIVIAVATLGAASPAELERRIESQIHMYAGDGCSGNEDYVEVFGSGTHECIRVPEAKRSYYVTGA